MTMTDLVIPAERLAAATSDCDGGQESEPVPATNIAPSPALRINEAAYKRAIARLHTSATQTSTERPISLGLLAAWLRGLNFSQVAVVAGMNETTLERILHGDLKLQASRRARIERMLEVTRLLRTILDEGSVGEWFMTPIPALKGLTPLEAARKRQLDAIEKVVQSYFDPSFG